MVLNVFASVSDKTGLAEALEKLSKTHQLHIVSSGGTASHLREAGFEVQEVDSLTGFKEVFGGRVKTLHPMVHMGLLYRDEKDIRELEEQGGRPFHVLIANLYPFAQAVEAGKDDLVEYVDIGGVALLRAAAKNFAHLSVFCDPRDYSQISEAVNSVDVRKKLAQKVFQTTSQLDAQISADLFGGERPVSVNYQTHRELRYGENPHQKGWWLVQEENGWHRAQILQGKEMSFNNFLDAEACLRALTLLRHPACVAVKHNNPCGAAEGRTLQEALERCLKADPVSVFGGVVGLSGAVGEAEARLLSSIFLEVILAPEFSPEARELLGQKKNLRLVEWKDMLERPEPLDIRPISGGAVQQELMRVTEDPRQWEVHGPPMEEQEIQDALLALKIVAELKSNAIAISSSLQTLGLGMGQVNRVDAVEHALARAKKFHPQTKNWTLASDAFFPFPDSIELMAGYPVRTVLQPGGSIKDKEVLAASQAHGIRMVLTGRRYFRH